MPDFYYKTAAGQNAFTVETQIADYVLDYPLGAAEPTAVVVTAQFMQTRADYSRPTANTTLTLTISGASRTLYFITDQNFSPPRGPVCTWTRVWATVPASWTEPEEYAYVYPSYDGFTLTGTAASITAIATSGANYVISTTATGITGGDYVFVQANYARNSIPGYVTVQWALVISASSGVSVTIAPIFPGNGSFTSVSGTIQEGAIGRTNQPSLIVGSNIVHDYALTSTASIDTDLPLFQPFSPILGFGSTKGEATLDLTSQTYPTSAQYAAMVINNSTLVAGCTRRRYMGNIYVRETRFIPAR